MINRIVSPFKKVKFDTSIPQTTESKAEEKGEDS